MKKDYTQINPVIAEAYDLLQKAAARTDGLSGLESGFSKLDKMTSGWQNSDLIIIAAVPPWVKQPLYFPWLVTLPLTKIPSPRSLVLA